ncbi:MAG: hypothetical protein PHF86_12290 [Candidatus Nanoarchaeia archaeon]|nr:hypothetical protein [Candidatus Nanoarchaeia archaeon]
MNEYVKTKKMENCLKMLELLKRRGRMKTNEIVEALGLNSKRSVNYYKNTLIYLGYDLVSYGGYDGGIEYIQPEFIEDDELNLIAEKLGWENSSLIEKIKRINKRIKL